jgi:hypothetical protein
MYKITSNVREVLQNEPNYLAKLDDLKKMLTLEKDLVMYCVHEAGHVTYSLKMGAQESSFVYHGPTIYFEPVPGEFRYFPCGVAIPKISPQNKTELEHLARISAAGGVFEEELENSTNLGDKDDRNKFHTGYAVALTNGVIPTQTEQEMWDWARNEIKSDLRQQAACIAARKLAEKIKERCFQIVS